MQIRLPRAVKIEPFSTSSASGRFEEYGVRVCPCDEHGAGIRGVERVIISKVRSDPRYYYFPLAKTPGIFSVFYGTPDYLG